MRLIALTLLSCPLWSQTQWTDLFDGESLAGWKAPFISGVAASSWEISEGVLHPLSVTRTADIWSATTYRNFLLEFEFKLAPHANGGIKYFVQEGISLRRRGNQWLPVESSEEQQGDGYVECTAGLEFQIVDDADEGTRCKKAFCSNL